MVEAEEQPIVTSAVQAILGWEPKRSGASLILMGRHLSLVLCGHFELASLEWHGVSVQCGSGAWARNLAIPNPDRHVNLSKWTIFEDRGGRLPRLYLPSEDKKAHYRELTLAFLRLWGLCETAQGGSELVTLIFFCKAGRHRSYGIMIAFLMWASRVHDPDLWASLIAPIRDSVLKSSSYPCELVSVEDLTAPMVQKGYVPFLSVLKDYAEFLNAEYPKHAWPAARS